MGKVRRYSRPTCRKCGCKIHELSAINGVLEENSCSNTECSDYGQDNAAQDFDIEDAYLFLDESTLGDRDD